MTEINKRDILKELVRDPIGFGAILIFYAFALPRSRVTKETMYRAVRRLLRSTANRFAPPGDPRRWVKLEDGSPWDVPGFAGSVDRSTHMAYEQDRPDPPHTTDEQWIDLRRPAKTGIVDYCAMLEQRQEFWSAVPADALDSGWDLYLQRCEYRSLRLRHMLHNDPQRFGRLRHRYDTQRRRQWKKLQVAIRDGRRV